MCLEVLCCVPIKAFIQVPARVGVGENVVGKAQRNMSNWKKLLGWVLQGTFSPRCCPEPIAPSLFLCLCDIWFARRQQQPSIAPLLSNFISKSYKMPVCLQYKHGARLPLMPGLRKAIIFLLEIDIALYQLSAQKYRRPGFSGKGAPCLFFKCASGKANLTPFMDTQ